MGNKNKKRYWQILILIASALIGAVACIMILSALTVFRSNIPLFKLINTESGLIVNPGERPTPKPGVEVLLEPKGVKLYMVLGSDYRPEAGFRTDVILFVIADRRSGKVSLVSFPRDLWVSIPGYGEQRINTVVQTGGFALLADTMQVNFGVYPTQFAMVDMEGFIEVVDVLGEIEVVTNQVTADSCPITLDPSGWCKVGPGTIAMDSEMALWYVRARYNSSDFDRMRRTQEVVEAVIKKATTPAGLLHFTELMALYENQVESNIRLNELLPLVSLGLGFDFQEDLQRFGIGPNETTPWTTPGGAVVLLPDTNAIQAILKEAFGIE